MNIQMTQHVRIFPRVLTFSLCNIRSDGEWSEQGLWQALSLQHSERDCGRRTSVPVRFEPSSFIQKLPFMPNSAQPTKGF